MIKLYHFTFIDNTKLDVESSSLVDAFNTAYRERKAIASCEGPSIKLNATQIKGE